MVNKTGYAKRETLSAGGYGSDYRFTNFWVTLFSPFVYTSR